MADPTLADYQKLLDKIEDQINQAQSEHARAVALFNDNPHSTLQEFITALDTILSGLERHRTGLVDAIRLMTIQSAKADQALAQVNAALSFVRTLRKDTHDE